MTSPDTGENNKIFLGFAQAESSKGSDQAHVILNLLDYYEVIDQMFAIGCDTTIIIYNWIHGRATQAPQPVPVRLLPFGEIITLWSCAKLP